MENGSNKSIRLLSVWLIVLGFAAVRYRSKVMNTFVRLYCWSITVTHLLYWVSSLSRKLCSDELPVINHMFWYSDAISLVMVTYYSVKTLTSVDAYAVSYTHLDVYKRQL